MKKIVELFKNNIVQIVLMIMLTIVMVLGTFFMLIQAIPQAPPNPANDEGLRKAQELQKLKDQQCLEMNKNCD